jgi:hypothetical protein
MVAAEGRANIQSAGTSATNYSPFFSLDPNGESTNYSPFFSLDPNGESTKYSPFFSLVPNDEFDDNTSVSSNGFAGWFPTFSPPMSVIQPRIMGQQGNPTPGPSPAPPTGVNVGHGMGSASRVGPIRGQFSSLSPPRRSNNNSGPHSAFKTGMTAGWGRDSTLRVGAGHDQLPTQTEYQNPFDTLLPQGVVDYGPGLPSNSHGGFGHGRLPAQPSRQISHNVTFPPLQQSSMNIGHDMLPASIGGFGYGQAPTEPDYQSNYNPALPPQQQWNMNTGRSMHPAPADGVGHGQALTRPNHQSNYNVAPPQQQQENLNAGQDIHPTPPSIRKGGESRSSSPPGTFNAATCSFPSIRGVYRLLREYLSIPHGSDKHDPGIEPPPPCGVLGSWPYQYPANMRPDPNDPEDHGLHRLARRVFEERNALSKLPGLVMWPSESVEEIRQGLCGIAVSRAPKRAKVNEPKKKT